MAPRAVAAGSVIVVGELLADVSAPRLDHAISQHPSEPVELTARPGGSPANVAVGLARLGIHSCFAGRISSGGLGPWLGAHMRANAVDLSLSATATERPTIAIVTLDSSGVASYSFYGTDTADWQWRRDELPEPFALGACAVHAGSLACALEPGAGVLGTWLDELRRAGDAFVSFDPNVRADLIKDLDSVRRMTEHRLAGAHLAKASEQDLETLYPGRSPLAAARALAGAGPELMVVTLGERGSVAIRPDGSVIERPSEPVEVEDTIGAGDSFMSALLAWLSDAGALSPGGPAGLSASEIGTALDTANSAAGITCSRPGVDPPHRHNLSTAPWPARTASGPGPFPGALS